MDSVTFKVEDMVCGNCVDIVRSSISAIKGVENIKIDPDSKIVQVDYDSGMIKEQNIKHVIKDIGYDVQ